MASQPTLDTLVAGQKPGARTLRTDVDASRSPRLASLQACRAVAAGLVVLYHVTAYLQERLQVQFLGGFFSFGFTGVDFFFVLSGFIIFYVHGGDIGKPARLGPYLLKRFIRIFPIYWVITLVKIGALLTLPGYAKDYELQADSIVDSLVLLPQQHLPIIGAAWTLSHELLFYLLFGLAIAYGRRLALCVLSIWVVGIVAVNGFLVLAGDAPWQVHYLVQFVLNARNGEFALGCLSAAIVSRYAIPRPGLLLIAGLLLYVAGGLLVDIAWSTSVVFYALMFGLASLLVVTSLSALEQRGRVRVPKILVLCGDASYSTYLLAFAFVNLIGVAFLRWKVAASISPDMLGAGLTVVAIGGGLLTYAVLERRLLQLTRTIRPGWRAERRSVPPGSAEHHGSGRRSTVALRGGATSGTN